MKFNYFRFIFFPYLSKNVLDLQNDLSQIKKQQKFVASSASDRLLASIIQDKLDPIEEGFKLELKEEFEIDLIEEFKIEPIAIKTEKKQMNTLSKRFKYDLEKKFNTEFSDSDIFTQKTYPKIDKKQLEYLQHDVRQAVLLYFVDPNSLHDKQKEIIYEELFQIDEEGIDDRIVQLKALNKFAKFFKKIMGD